MTPRLAKALQVLRHLRGERVFLQDDGSPLTRKVLRRWVAGHANLSTTMRYMPLQAGAKQAAIALLVGTHDVSGPSARASAGESGLAWQRRGNAP